MDDEKYSAQEVAFAQEVARRREKLGWTLGEMAHALSREGIDYANAMTVSRTEKLQRPIRMNEALAYARIFQTSVDQMTSTAKLDREIAMANELVNMSQAHIKSVVDSVARVHWNWKTARKVRDELLQHDSSELTEEQQERRAVAVHRLEALIELDLIAELDAAWRGAPE